MNQSTSGTDKVNAIINTHLLTGRIGRPGMGPFSLTGQPNAMGGREVGGLANQLAAHLRFNAADLALLTKAWKAPSLARRPGLKAVEMFEAVATGKIKAIWIMATNPVVSLPDADRVRAALARCEFVVVSDCVRDTDTTRYAHVKLPALAWGEKDGTVTNSERRISRQRAVLPPPGLAKPDWWMVAELARRLGYRPGLHLFERRQKCFASTPLCRAPAMTARVFSIFPASRKLTTSPTRRWRPCNGRSRRVAQPVRRACSATGALRRMVAVSWPCAPGPPRRRSMRRFRSPSTPAACAISGTP